MLSVSCVQCGSVFQYEPKGGNRRKYCSLDCRNVRYGRLSPDRRCQGCGVELAGLGKGKVAKWCSGACRARTLIAAETPEQRAARLHRERERSRAVRGTLPPKPDRRCLHCNEIMRGPRGEFCSKRPCQTAAYRRRRLSASHCSVDGCDKPIQGKGLCGTHYAAMWRAANMDKYRAKNHRYRASKKAAAVAENVSPHVVFEADNWRCHICLEKIDKRLKFPDLMSASLDHVIPLSKGGEHSYENCRASHFICNSTKRDLGVGDQMLLLSVKPKVVKQWPVGDRSLKMPRA